MGHGTREITNRITSGITTRGRRGTRTRWLLPTREYARGRAQRWPRQDDRDRNGRPKRQRAIPILVPILIPILVLWEPGIDKDRDEDCDKDRKDTGPSRVVLPNGAAETSGRSSGQQDGSCRLASTLAAEPGVRPGQQRQRNRQNQAHREVTMYLP